jgi:hypothetical protein
MLTLYIVCWVLQMVSLKCRKVSERVYFRRRQLKIIEERGADLETITARSLESVKE